MQLLEVIPITHSFGPETLSYFHKSSLPKNALVSVPIRKRDVPALVVSCRPASEQKALLRKSDFVIKKISGVISKEPFFPQSFLKAANDTAEMYLAQIGPLLNSLIPKTIWEESELFKNKTEESDQKNTGDFRRRLIQGSFKYRTKIYRTSAKDVLKNQSVLILAPTVRQTDRLAEELAEFAPLVFQSKLSKKKQQQTALDIRHTKKPVLVVGTYPTLSILPENTGLIIIDSIGDLAYRTQKRPKFDTSFLAQRYAKHLGAKLIIGDELIPADYSNEKVEMQKDTGKTPQTTISDMRKDEEKQPPTAFVSEDFLKTLLNRDTSRVFVFAPRRGLAGHVVCNDCSQSVTCNECQSPVVLHKIQNKNVFLCHACGAKRSAHETCTNCQSWNLVALGLGIDGLAEEIKTLAPEIKVFQISSDKTSSEKKILVEIEKWQNEGGVLLGTQMALPYIKNSDVSVIASLDASLSLPSYKSREEIFRTILKILDLTSEKLIIQTRNPENPFVSFLKDLDTDSFMNEEREMRKEFGYPPEKVLVKISCGRTETADKLSALLARYEPIRYKPHTSKNRKHVSDDLLIRVPAVDAGLKKLLLSLPPDAHVEVNPLHLF